MDSQPYLPDGPVLAENVVHFFRGNLERKVSYIENSIDLRRETNLQETIDATDVSTQSIEREELTLARLAAIA